MMMTCISHSGSHCQAHIASISTCVVVIAMYGQLLASLLIRSLLIQAIQKQPNKIGMGNVYANLKVGIEERIIRFICLLSMQTLVSASLQSLPGADPGFCEGGCTA